MTPPVQLSNDSRREGSKATPAIARRIAEDPIRSVENSEEIVCRDTAGPSTATMTAKAGNVRFMECKENTSNVTSSLAQTLAFAEDAREEEKAYAL